MQSRNRPLSAIKTILYTTAITLSFALFPSSTEAQSTVGVLPEARDVTFSLNALTGGPAGNLSLSGQATILPWLTVELGVGTDIAFRDLEDRSLRVSIGPQIHYDTLLTPSVRLVAGFIAGISFDTAEGFFAEDQGLTILPTFFDEIKVGEHRDILRSYAGLSLIGEHSIGVRAGLQAGIEVPLNEPEFVIFESVLEQQSADRPPDDQKLDIAFFTGVLVGLIL